MPPNASNSRQVMTAFTFVVVAVVLFGDGCSRSSVAPTNSPEPSTPQVFVQFAPLSNITSYTAMFNGQTYNSAGKFGPFDLKPGVYTITGTLQDRVVVGPFNGGSMDVNLSGAQPGKVGSVQRNSIRVLYAPDVVVRPCGVALFPIGNPPRSGNFSFEFTVTAATDSTAC
jgi:hypothetical protein